MSASKQSLFTWHNGVPNHCGRSNIIIFNSPALVQDPAFNNCVRPQFHLPPALHSKADSWSSCASPPGPTSHSALPDYPPADSAAAGASVTSHRTRSSGSQRGDTPWSMDLLPVPHFPASFSSQEERALLPHPKELTTHFVRPPVAERQSSLHIRSGPNFSATLLSQKEGAQQTEAEPTMLLFQQPANAYVAA